MIPAADRHEDPTTDDFSSRANEFELLIQKADQVRRALDELSSLREAALASAEQDAQKIRDEAADGARRVQAEAEEEARETLEQAHETAAEMLRAVRTEMEQLVDTATKRKAAVETTLNTLDKLADVLTPRPAGISSPEPSEPFATQSGGPHAPDEAAESADEPEPPPRDSSFDDARSEVYAPLDFEQQDSP